MLRHTQRFLTALLLTFAVLPIAHAKDVIHDAE